MNSSYIGTTYIISGEPSIEYLLEHTEIEHLLQGSGLRFVACRVIFSAWIYPALIATRMRVVYMWLS